MSGSQHPNDRPAVSVAMRRQEGLGTAKPNLRRLGGVCACGTGQLLSYGGPGGPDKWDCCSPWQDQTTGKIVDYGWDHRGNPTVPPGGKPIATAMKAKPATELHPLLTQIGPAPAGMTTCLYERFDVDSVHLYAGISDAPGRRAKIHLKRSTWFQFATSGTERWFPSRAAAEAAERAVVEACRPIFNRQHSHPEARHNLIRYLVDHERFDLVEVTATWG